MVLLTPEALNAFAQAVPGMVLCALGAGLCIWKNRIFYILVLGGSIWSSLVMLNYVQRVLEVSEMPRMVRGMMLALPAIFFILLNVGVLASMSGTRSEDNEEE